jgi:hypothetical protein
MYFVFGQVEIISYESHHFQVSCFYKHLLEKVLSRTFTDGISRLVQNLFCLL